MAKPSPAIMNYVICATLQEVADVFNVEDLWQRARRRQQGEFLMEALSSHLLTRKSRHRKETRYFHIIVRIPKADYDRDARLENGFQRQALVQDLLNIHNQKLGKYIPEGETVRYRIESDSTLPGGQVRFVFGRAIFLPVEETPSRYRLYRLTEPDGSHRELGDIYPGQRLTLLNGDPYVSTIAVPDWPFTNKASVLIITDPDEPTRIYAEPDGSLEILSEEPAAFPVRDKQDTAISPEAPRGYCIGDRQGNTLRLVLADPDSQPKPGIGNDRTWVGGETTTTAHLQVIGIALQRLSLYPEAGIAGWRLGFDRLGRLVGCRHPSAVAWLRVDQDDRLWGETGSDTDPMALLPPTEWQPLPALTLELHAAPEAMAERYCGWLRLPRTLPLPLPRDHWCSFGRGDEVDLRPGLLADSQALQWQTTPRSINPEQLNLSRRHLGLCLDDKGWTVRLESDKLPAYRLDTEGELIQMLGPEDSGEEIAVAGGERIVAGGYVLEMK